VVPERRYVLLKIPLAAQFEVLSSGHLRQKLLGSSDTGFKQQEH
jgi:hypothetical protein